ncbi:hypothetical protein [Mumia zhuanghuii]|uniref:Uncharacterized protein n=1 Tax=Mumia zhuanghuii TaxID=2585211 RepID=A0A5C4MEW9_9ACTN|nr:hypothetical protein [Mumia zhuanghuii]TNC31278.1 hypothetical protein FHE65_31895 [Mumia zhuanghuii]
MHGLQSTSVHGRLEGLVVQDSEELGRKALLLGVWRRAWRRRTELLPHEPVLRLGRQMQSAWQLPPVLCQPHYHDQLERRSANAGVLLQ